MWVHVGRTRPANRDSISIELKVKSVPTRMSAMRWMSPAACACLGVAAGLAACSDDIEVPLGTTATSTGVGTAASTSGVGSQVASSGNGFSSGSGMTGPAFPIDPILEPGVPANVRDLFGDPAIGVPDGAPCLVEPEAGSLLPNNWLRPRFRYVPDAAHNLFEIRLHAASEPNDLVVYTADTTWTMPANLWALVGAGVQDEPIDVTVRAANFDGTAIVGDIAKVEGTITIAPVGAPGTIVYWTTSGGSSLKGFTVGDESVVLALAPAQVQMPTTGGQVTCVGCHTATPDGLFASYVAQSPWSNGLASIEQMTVGNRPPFLGAGAETFLATSDNLGIHTYSVGHWADGDRTMVTPSGSGASDLIWVDLEASVPTQGTAWDVIARTGDAFGAGAPTWSHDGNTIVYVSTDSEVTGRLDAGHADLYAVPYNNRAGGAATPIPGAAEAALSEYYPAFSPDDSLVAFNRIPDGQNMYNAANAEVFVIPTPGGTPTRLAANDPPACTGKSSPGITNSWPKWSPEAQIAGGRTFYWIIFSSTRGEAGNPQLYVTGVVVEGSVVTTYPALYLWNQPAAENNHTPAWDAFEIPPVPVPQ